ncbi:arginine repressor [Actinomycetaceae bacterium L2_0104]
MAEAFIPGTRSARQALIAQILVKEKIGSQSHLQARLREDGISVTQATLSRDLDEMSAFKVKDADGKQVYRVPEPVEVHAATQGARVQLARWCTEVLISVQQAGNQLVLRTPPGAAQLLASGIDRAMLDGVLGCIAGDDTVLVVASDDATASRLRNELLDLK